LDFVNFGGFRGFRCLDPPQKHFAYTHNSRYVMLCMLCYVNLGTTSLGLTEVTTDTTDYKWQYVPTE